MRPNYAYQQTVNTELTDIWLQQFLEPWGHQRQYKYKIFIASCTDNIHDLEKERWLFGEMVDHLVIYGSKAAENFLALSAGLVCYIFLTYIANFDKIMWTALCHQDLWSWFTKYQYWTRFIKYGYIKS